MSAQLAKKEKKRKKTAEGSVLGGGDACCYTCLVNFIVSRRPQTERQKWKALTVNIHHLE